MRPGASGVTALVFDVDGTLYHQPPLRRAMVLKLAAHAALRPGTALSTFRALRAYRHAQELLREAQIEGGLAAAQMRLACERSGLSEALVASIVGRWMDEEPLGLVGNFVPPALRTLLDAARERGIRLGVLSDYPAAAKLKAMNLTEYFDVVVTAQDPRVNRFKPHPAGLLEALRLLGAAPHQALYVGDRRDVDARVAEAVGSRCVIVGDKTRSTGWIPVADYRELHSLLFLPEGRIPS